MNASSISSPPSPHIAATDTAAVAPAATAARPASAAPPLEIPAPTAKFTPPSIDAKNFGKQDGQLRDVLDAIAAFIDRMHDSLCRQPKEARAHDKAKTELAQFARKIPETFRPDVRRGVERLSAAIDTPPAQKGQLVKELADIVPITVDDHAGAALRNLAKKLESALIA
jgi:hypothetical protein